MRQLCCLLFFVYLFAQTGSAQPKTKAPNFSLKTLEGKIVELSKLKGKVVVINFWATWCGPCRAEIPAFLEVYEKYKEKGLEIVGISLDEDGWREVKPFVQKFRITYPIVVGDEKLSRRYGTITAIPTTFIIDKNGNIVDRHLGALIKESFENLIKNCL